MAEPPFFEVQLALPFSIKCRHANAFRLELSSSNSNILTIGASSFAMNPNMQSKNLGYLCVSKHDLATPTNDNFQAYDIPFENMVMEEQNLKKDRFFEHDLVPMTPTMISVYCESMTEATFDFKIKKISGGYFYPPAYVNFLTKKDGRSHCRKMVEADFVGLCIFF